MKPSKREQIAQAAMQLFIQHGYRETSMDQIAAEADVSKHTIYNHFHSKEGLFIELVEQFIDEQFQPEFQSELSDEPATGLRRLAEAFLLKMNNPEYGAFLRLLIAESGHFPHLAQLFIRRVIGEESHSLKQYFESHPDWQIRDPELTAYIFLSSMSSFILFQEVMQGKSILSIEQDRLIDQLVDLVLSNSAVQVLSPP
ncbi:MAG: TetR/AcrR family transcriptional regulator [Coleofasciculus sp. G3-WIS-01]|uniref:TetR/AcrR family transcriptional regulator n=1 Tax=Coleofasciculus sp. G3-WIS-01 TaxID=3069528 RepID=UPI0032F89348